MRSALVSAIVAAVVAVASATAATVVVITSKDIKDGTIQAVDLSAAAKSALEGRRGLPGPRGGTGRAGAAGARGRIAFQSLRRVSTHVPGIDPHTAELATATCATGENAISGGSSGGGLLLGSFSDGNGWSALRLNPSDSYVAHFVFALCAQNVAVSLVP